MARKYHSANGEPKRYRILTFEGAFHGRTLATIAAGGQKKYLEGFGPKVDGFDQIAVRATTRRSTAAIAPETAAILIEPIQGEGGIRSVPTVCLKGLRQLCDEHGLLLILDEVQTGVGRTGKLFAHEWAGIAPDIMAVAKGIGGGFPMGACLATAEAGKGMTAGVHGTTFGGNPLAMAVGNAVLDVVLADGFLRRVDDAGLLLAPAPGRDRRPPSRRARGGARPGPDARPEDPRPARRLRGRPPRARRFSRFRPATMSCACCRRLIVDGRGDPRRRAPASRPPASARRADLTAAAHPNRQPPSERCRGIFSICPKSPAADLRSVLDEAAAIKARARQGRAAPRARPLAGKVLAMVFERPSTRTRVSFDVGMRELGGETIMLTGAEMQLGRGETIADTARVLSRYVDAIMIRMLDHAAVQRARARMPAFPSSTA